MTAMTPSTNPFDQLVRLANGRRPRRPRRPLVPRKPAQTKVRTLIDFLREGGPASTLTLCHLIDAESRVVWGLMKAPRTRGEVLYAEGRWCFVDAYDAELRDQIKRAATLLRSNGWRVLPPRGAQP